MVDEKTFWLIEVNNVIGHGNVITTTNNYPPFIYKGVKYVTFNFSYCIGANGERFPYLGMDANTLKGLFHHLDAYQHEFCLSCY